MLLKYFNSIYLARILFTHTEKGDQLKIIHKHDLRKKIKAKGLIIKYKKLQFPAEFFHFQETISFNVPNFIAPGYDFTSLNNVTFHSFLIYQPQTLSGDSLL